MTAFLRSCRFLPVCLSVAAILLPGCGPDVVRGTDDPGVDRRALSTRLDQRDINLLVGKMADQLVASPFFEEVTADGRKPRIALDELVNESGQHLNSEEILTLIQGRIVNSRRMTFVDRAQREKIEREIGMQLRDAVDQRTASQLGKQYGIQYFLMGKVFGTVERLDRLRVQYRISLKVVNLETLAIEWQADESVTKEMR